MNYLLKLSLVLLIGILVVSCTSEESNGDAGVVAENFGTVSGGGCLDLVYPLTFEFVNGITVEVQSKEELKEAVIDYRDNNPEERAKPQLNFPVEVVTEEGEMLTIESKKELREIKRAECGGNDSRGSRGDMKKCFTLLYPVSFSTEDGTVISGETRKEIKQALKAWRAGNPEASEKPTLQYPIEIINSEGEIVAVATAEELAVIKEDCKG